jgi:predicted  nucleic acid-binding Zn-ribbon protein
MDWGTAGQAINTVGGIGGIIALLGFIGYYGVRKRKIKAEARLIERQGDSESISSLMEIIETLKGENARLSKRLDACEDKIEELEKRLKVKDWVISIYEKASKYCHKCGYLPEGTECPAVTEYKRLTK